MRKDKRIKIRFIRCKIPKKCICPACGMEQVSRVNRRYVKKVKTINVNVSEILVVERVQVLCTNPSCARKSFVLPTPGVEKYQRVTNRVKREALDKNVLDNVPYEKTAASLRRLNTSGSKSSIDRWKQREAERYSFRDIISQLGFSGILSIDEYKPKRAIHYDLIAGDTIRWHILYLETLKFSPHRAGTIPRGSVQQFCEHIKGLGIEPRAVIVDLMAAYPKQVWKVWPNIILQYDYYHVIQAIHKHLNRALLAFRRSLVGKEMYHYRAELWEHRWRFLTNMDNWTEKDHKLIPELLDIYEDTLVEQVLLFKEGIDTIFNKSSSRTDAYKARDSMFQEQWWKDSTHLAKAMKFLTGSRFEYMITYLSHPEIPRCGNIENMIREWRIAEKVRFGFKTEKGRQNHLKLYQIKKYLGKNSIKFGKGV